MNIERLKEITKIADKLKWLSPPKERESYPTMQLSEVEKCMMAMYDDSELNRMRKMVMEIGDFENEEALVHWVTKNKDGTMTVEVRVNCQIEGESYTAVRKMRLEKS